MPNRYRVWKPGSPQFAKVIMADSSLEARKVVAAVTPGMTPEDLIARREPSSEPRSTYGEDTRRGEPSDDLGESPDY